MRRVILNIENISKVRVQRLPENEIWRSIYNRYLYSLHSSFKKIPVKKRHVKFLYRDPFNDKSFSVQWEMENGNIQAIWQNVSLSLCAYDRGRNAFHDWTA